MSLRVARRSGSRPARTRGLRAFAVVVAVPLLGACGLILETVEPEPERSFYAEGVHALEVGDFAGAEDRFRRVAARCESGAEGRSSLLALTTLHLDLGNPNGRPDEAARFAAIHLNLPHAPAAERSLARTLYLLSIYRGADPVEGPEELVAGATVAADAAELDGESADTVGGAETPDSLGGSDLSSPNGTDPEPDPMLHAGSGARSPQQTADFEPARRFEECDVDTVVWRGVPEYPGTPPSRWAEGPTQSDEPGDTVLIRDTGAVGRAAALQAKVNELEAELARIRKLLQGGGGGGEVPKLRP